MNNRKMAANGQFYPNSKDEILNYFDHFNELANEYKFDFKCDFTPRALIVPHAGYIYSGFTANIAYKIALKNSDIKRVIIIGPSHKFGFDGASISLYENYETPFGDMKIDEEYANSLYENFNNLDFIDEVHCEHSTETQVPFVKHNFPNSEVVEIIYSNSNFQDIEKLIEYILNDKENLLIISTDLSHFHDITKATHLDKICLDAITTLDIEKLNKGCEACGMIGIKALVNYANKKQMKVKFCDYRTSADVTKDRSSVVGYTSFVFGE